jgi:hypothetical protein
MDPKLRDARIRQTAFDTISQLASARGGTLEAGDLRGGFVFDGDRIPLINPQRSIFKPRQIGWLLRIRTVFPRHSTFPSTQNSSTQLVRDMSHQVHRCRGIVSLQRRYTSSTRGG